MKRMIFVFMVLGLIGIYSKAYSCPTKDKSSYAYIHDATAMPKPYKSVFVEGANLKDYEFVELRVKGVMCEKCIQKIEANLKGVEGVVGMEYLWEKKLLKVFGKNLNLDKVISAIKKAGYKAKPNTT